MFQLESITYSVDNAVSYHCDDIPRTDDKARPGSALVVEREARSMPTGDW